MVNLNSEQYIIPYPQLADAAWHSIFLELGLEAFNVTVDYLYKKVVKHFNSYIFCIFIYINVLKFLFFLIFFITKKF